MEFLEGEALRKGILESYSKSPRGWSFVISPSKSGFFDAVASGPDGAWMLKIDSIFKPSPIVLGSQAETGPGLKAVSPVSYGYRKMPPDLLLRFLERSGQGNREQMDLGLRSFLKSEPVVPTVGGSYAHGPFVLTGPRTLSLSEGQQAVGTRLTAEMHRLLKMRYPAYG